MTQDEYAYPKIGITKYHIRALNALEDKSEHRKKLHDISGYVANLYEYEKNVLSSLVQDDLVQKESDEIYSITERGESSLNMLLEYRDIDTLDARDVDEDKPDSFASVSDLITK